MPIGAGPGQKTARRGTQTQKLATPNPLPHEFLPESAAALYLQFESQARTNYGNTLARANLRVRCRFLFRCIEHVLPLQRNAGTAGTVALPPGQVSE